MIFKAAIKLTALPKFSMSPLIQRCSVGDILLIQFEQEKRLDDGAGHLTSPDVTVSIKDKDLSFNIKLGRLLQLLSYTTYIEL